MTPGRRSAADDDHAAVLRQRVAALHRQGLAQAIIAQRLSLNRKTVANWLKAAAAQQDAAP